MGRGRRVQMLPEQPARERGRLGAMQARLRGPKATRPMLLRDHRVVLASSEGSRVYTAITVQHLRVARGLREATLKYRLACVARLQSVGVGVRTGPACSTGMQQSSLRRQSQRRGFLRRNPRLQRVFGEMDCVHRLNRRKAWAVQTR